MSEITLQEETAMTVSLKEKNKITRIALKDTARTAQ
jgi:hypothetical protein